MILSEDSLIKNPSVIFNKELVVSLNAIRYSVEICELSYLRLIGLLSRMTDKKEKNVEDYEFSEIYSQAWSIIHNSVVLRNLLYTYFKPESTSPVLNEIDKAVQLRHSYQHIDERIKQILAEKDFPVFGALSWFKRYPNSNKAIFCSTYSGSFTSKKMPKVTFSNEKDENPDNFIQKIELTNIVREKANGKKDRFFESTIHISKLMYDLSDIMEHVEEGLKFTFPGADKEERHNSDLIIRLKGIVND
jgi:hypothetical protein